MSYKYTLRKFGFQIPSVFYGLQNTEHSKKWYNKMNKAKPATLTKSLPTAGPHYSQDIPGLEPAGQYVLFHHCSGEPLSTAVLMPHKPHVVPELRKTSADSTGMLHAAMFHCNRSSCLGFRPDRSEMSWLNT